MAFGDNFLKGWCPGTLPDEHMIYIHRLRHPLADEVLSLRPAKERRGVGSMNQVKPVSKVIMELIEEYIEAIERLNTITEG